MSGLDIALTLVETYLAIAVATFLWMLFGVVRRPAFYERHWVAGLISAAFALAWPVFWLLVLFVKDEHPGRN